jgi:hypothetical protein
LTLDRSEAGNNSYYETRDHENLEHAKIALYLLRHESTLDGARVVVSDSMSRQKAGMAMVFETTHLAACVGL